MSAQPIRESGQAATSVTPPVKKNRLAGLEGPRGIGALTIVFLHCAAHFMPSFIANTRVDIFGQWLTFFFVLSGFLLYMPYAKRFVEGKTMPSSKDYMMHRLKRILPAYLFIFLIANFVLRAVYVHNPLESERLNLPGAYGGVPGTGMITDPLQLLSELTLTQTFFPATIQTGINPAWSLTTEFLFYLTLPVIGFVIFRYARATARPFVVLLVPVVLLWILGVGFNTFVLALQHSLGVTGLDAYWGPNWAAVASRTFFALADTFAMGMLTAVAYVALSKGFLASVRLRTLQWWITGAIVVLLLVSLATFAFAAHYLQTPAAMASAAVILLIVLPGARGEHSALAVITDWAPMRVVGTMSLSVYLWHFPILLVVARVFTVPPTMVGLLWVSLLIIAITLVAATFTYRYIEAPALAGRWPFTRAPKATAKAAG